ncbi:fatty acid desaturase family protein [Salinibacterium soli]|uniref:Acyl-CoA desaturase n=1 Tax=Antiquaquibacter soli TaxID=3064523 RepID=A0ABT9BLQ7_9MICO|nr:acyl-CoA desaturase [Protaetiibacter sp. WY-16]MDO7881909.1 acyl-CoA desaturase [Protaetiibacter sp. WY-16]
MTAASSPSTRIIRTGPRGVGNPVSEFSALLNTVRDAGLLRRNRVFYLVVVLAITTGMVAAWFGVVMLRDTWFTLLVAAAMGILFTQFAFVTHEFAHRQVFSSGRANDTGGRILSDLVVGISYSWWMAKHTRHHANPNTVGKDPDILPDFIVFQESDATARTRLGRFLQTRQGWLFFPALLLEGVNLHRHAFLTVFSPGKVDKRALEITLLLTRNVLYVGAVFAILPLGMAFAFLGVQLAVFGLYMGASFAPNHKGMPILPRDSKVDFLRRQVLTSRNIGGGAWVTQFMGGLNFQVEHHLFPSMPRPHLRRAGEIVREFCESRGIPYTEVSILRSYAIVIRHLNAVGLGADRDPFACPAAGRVGYSGLA